MSRVVGTENETTIRVTWGTEWNELREEHQQEIIRWRKELFPQCPDEPVLSWEPNAEGGVVVYCDGHVASSLKIVRRDVRANDEQIKAGGVSGVMTIPDFRRRGFARLALDEARQVILNTLGADMGLLLCPHNLVPFYSRCGFTTLHCPVVFDQPEGKKTWDKNAMVFWREGSEREPEAIDLSGLPW